MGTVASRDNGDARTSGARIFPCPVLRWRKLRAPLFERHFLRCHFEYDAESQLVQMGSFALLRACEGTSDQTRCFAYRRTSGNSQCRTVTPIVTLSGGGRRRRHSLPDWHASFDAAGFADDQIGLQDDSPRSQTGLARHPLEKQLAPRLPNVSAGWSTTVRKGALTSDTSDAQSKPTMCFGIIHRLARSIRRWAPTVCGMQGASQRFCNGEGLARPR